LNDWLPEVCESDIAKTRAEAIGQTGKQYLHIGDYDTALQYLKQSLAITQEIGDVAGLCATLFNMGHIHLQNEEVPEAINAWINVYLIAKPMQLAQALEALESLAERLGLPGGLQGWEMLARQRDNEQT
jgi:tetratricopeptide (TPR) repeat protein